MGTLALPYHIAAAIGIAIAIGIGYAYAGYVV